MDLMHKWPIIGKPVSKAIMDFFKKGMMLKQLRASFIVLVPKTENASTPDKFRPISFTNELYKFISQILVNLVGPIQSAFVPGRSIVNNNFQIHKRLQNVNTCHMYRLKEQCWLYLFPPCSPYTCFPEQLPFWGRAYPLWGLLETNGTDLVHI